jgi:hypothetical protein
MPKHADQPVTASLQKYSGSSDRLPNLRSGRLDRSRQRKPRGISSVRNLSRLVDTEPQPRNQHCASQIAAEVA